MSGRWPLASLALPNLEARASCARSPHSPPAGCPRPLPESLLTHLTPSPPGKVLERQVSSNHLTPPGSLKDSFHRQALPGGAGVWLRSRRSLGGPSLSSRSKAHIPTQTGPRNAHCCQPMPPPHTCTRAAGTARRLLPMLSHRRPGKRPGPGEGRGPQPGSQVPSSCLPTTGKLSNRATLWSSLLLPQPYPSKQPLTKQKEQRDGVGRGTQGGPPALAPS